jgi:hypothetical protein
MPSAAAGPVAVAPVVKAPAAALPFAGISPDLYPTEDDLPYEEEILREPFKLKGWWRYLVARAAAPFAKRAVIYERALKALPGSYKLWYAYLRERLDHARPHPISHQAYSSLNNTFERALATMHKMPRVWVLYLTSLLDQRLLTRGRRSFDRALRALPVTQHDRIWPLYLRLASLQACPVETSFRASASLLVRRWSVPGAPGSIPGAPGPIHCRLPCPIAGHRGRRPDRPSRLCLCSDWPRFPCRLGFASRRSPVLLQSGFVLALISLC